MRTTKKQLLEMLEPFTLDSEIILVVRGNRTTDYAEQQIVVYGNAYDDVIVIEDKLSY